MLELKHVYTRYGAVETIQEAALYANFLQENRGKFDGVILSLPNFGDEKGVADTLQLAGLNVPVLVQAYPDDLTQLSVERRRDGGRPGRGRPWGARG